MDRKLTISEIIQKGEDVQTYLINQIKTITAFNSVTDNVGDLMNNLNYPLCVVFLDEYPFDNDNEANIIFTIILKNKGSSNRANTALLKSISTILENRKLGNNCLISKINNITNHIDTATAAKIEVKSVISRIELGVKI